MVTFNLKILTGMVCLHRGAETDIVDYGNEISKRTIHLKRTWMLHGSKYIYIMFSYQKKKKKIPLIIRTWGRSHSVSLHLGRACLSCLSSPSLLPANCQRWKEVPQYQAYEERVLSNICMNSWRKGFKRELMYLYNIHSLYNSAEDCVLVIEPWCSDSGYEKLRAISVGTRICHGESEGPVVS